MDSLFIFGAKYLWIASALIALYAFYKSEIKFMFFKTGALILPISYIAGIIARMLYYNPRPFVVNNFTPLIEHASDNGFPSDHALLVASLAALVTIFNRKLGLVLWIIAIFVAISRVYAGVHHVLDVVGSFAISIAVALVIYFLNNRKQNATNTAPTSSTQ